MLRGLDLRLYFDTPDYDLQKAKSLHRIDGREQGGAF